MGFRNSHPFVHLLYFLAVIYTLLAFSNPVYLLIAFVSAIIYACQCSAGKIWKYIVAIFPLIILYAMYYASYHHFGVTVLGENRIGNSLTAEAYLYGMVVGVTAAAFVLWLYILHQSISMDEIGYLLGRVSPGASLMFSIFLRMLSRIHQQRRYVLEARNGIGKGVSRGKWWSRIYNRISVFSIMLTWILETLSSMADSMKSRGKNLRGRTSYSRFIFDDRDRAQMLFITAMLVLSLMAHTLGQTNAIYDPEIIIPPPMPLTPLFYMGYAGLCLMPSVIDVFSGVRFAWNRRNVKEKCINEK